MKKAAAYVRVSTSKKEQMHSFEFQSAYWENELLNNPDYEYVGIYADKGISGKSLEKRPQLQALIRACLEGKVDIVFTKSVSRFARSIENMLETVHLLREHGVGIYFEKEAINTLETSSDLYLSVAVAIAENDLREYSKRIRDGINMRTDLGILSVGNGVYGYMLKDNALYIEPKEAEVVRSIFDWYLHGNTIADICDKLNESGERTRRGNLWSGTTIRQMLSNEKYCGDAILHKYVTVNGRKQLNDGDALSKYIENNHEAIISRDVYEKTQQDIIKRRKEKLVGQEVNEYIFTGKILCGKCGKKYTHKFNNANMPCRTEVWSCSTYLKNGKKYCDNSSIKDSVLKEKFTEAYNELVNMNYECGSVVKLRKEYKRLLAIERNMITLKTRGLISQQGYDEETPQIVSQLKELKDRIDALVESGISKKDLTPITSFDEDKAKRFVEKVIVQDWTVTFHFVNGARVMKHYNNGQPGNIYDWVKKNRRRK